MTQPLISAHIGPWHVTLTRPSNDPGDGRAVTSTHVVIASCVEEATAEALSLIAQPDAPIDPATVRVSAGRICG